MFYAVSREILYPAASGVISNQKGNGDNAPLLYTCSLFPRFLMRLICILLHWKKWKRREYF